MEAEVAVFLDKKQLRKQSELDTVAQDWAL